MVLIPSACLLLLLLICSSPLVHCYLKSVHCWRLTCACTDCGVCLASGRELLPAIRGRILLVQDLYYAHKAHAWQLQETSHIVCIALRPTQASELLHGQSQGHLQLDAWQLRHLIQTREEVRNGGGTKKILFAIYEPFKPCKIDTQNQNLPCFRAHDSLSALVPRRKATRTNST